MGVPVPSFVNAGDGLFTHPIGEFARWPSRGSTSKVRRCVGITEDIACIHPIGLYDIWRSYI